VERKGQYEGKEGGSRGWVLNGKKWVTRDWMTQDEESMLRVTGSKEEQGTT